MRRLGAWLDERTGHRAALRWALEEPVPGGASFAYVFGSVLTFILILQLVTGVFLALYYSPSAGSAWASVAYIQDQVTLGWFVRGLHHYGASAMVVVAGLHMLQTAVWGAYKKPREVTWWLGVLMFGLLLAFALTGYLLPWDQTGYWATKVATGIAGSTPIIGQQLKEAVQGGNEYGNLTLTRFFAIHAFLLPGALIAVVGLHIVLFRRHGQTPHWWLDDKELARRAQPFWPDQLFRDLVAMAAVFAALVVINLRSHGAHLDAPADPASNFDARPEWYFRPLFQALKYFHGALETVVALGAPVVVGGILLSLPLLDRGPDRNPRRRLRYLAALGAIFVGAGALTAISFREDAGDEAYAARMVEADALAEQARALAVDHGVPTEGGPAVFSTAPFYAARKTWQAECAGCHEGERRKAPIVGAGYNSRAWIRGFLVNPSARPYYGVTGINKMKPVTLTGADLDAVVELVYAQTGAGDADPQRVARGQALFDDAGDCSNCHSLDPHEEGDTGPNLGGRGSAAWLTEFIGQPGHPRYFGAASEMPGFADEWSRHDRHELAEYLVSLRERPLPDPQIEGKN